MTGRDVGRAIGGGRLGRLGELDAVAALPLGHVQGRVGEALEPVQGVRVVRVAGHADGGRDRYVGKQPA